MQFPTRDFRMHPDDFRSAEIIDGTPLDGDALADGEVIVAVDILALTANTISYGIAGKSRLIPYFDSFPAPDPYVRLPFWGFGDIVASAHPDLPVGERLYGLYPLSSHLTAKMDTATAAGCRDVSPQRATIPPFYSDYSRVAAEAGYDPAFDAVQSLLRPVIATGFLLDHYLTRHDFYGAQQVIITSASSKTSFGFGHFLVNQHGDRCRAIGLTSARNKAFVEKTGCYHKVLTYDEVASLPQEPSVMFDMAGNAELRAAVHRHLGDKIAYSGTVGATHWEKGAADAPDLPGARPVFWSGPDEVAVVAKETADSQQMMTLLNTRVAGLMKEAAQWLNIRHYEGGADILQAYRDMLDGKMAAEDAVIFSVKAGL